MFRKLILIASCVMVSCAPVGTPVQSDTDVPQVDNTASPVLGGVSVEETETQDTVLTEDVLNIIPPEDIIEQIGFFGGLGGAGDGCDITDYQEPAFYWMADHPYEWMATIPIMVCGIPVGEQVQVNVALPDGTTSDGGVLTASQTFDRDTGEITFYYMPLVHSPTGDYVFTFSGENWTLDYPVTVIEPPDARLYIYESELFLINFQPKENIRLFVYGFDNSYGGWELMGWKQYEVDDTGDLTISTQIDDAGFVAIGEVSGQRSVGLFPGDVYCKGAQSVGIVPLKYAEVIRTSNELAVYTSEVENGTWIQKDAGTLQVGEIVRIQSNAECKNGTFWWNISSVGNRSVWGTIPESGTDGPYLRPLAELPATSTPDPSTIPVCQGTLPTRLHVGMNAEVTTSGMAPQLSLRAQPSLNAEKVHVIAAGRDMVILDGPVCADNSYWWYIRSEQGFEGWAREGDFEDYWIDPLP